MSQTVHDFQIRVTDPVWMQVKGFLDPYIDVAAYGFAFKHMPNPDNHHYHIYLFNVPRTADAIRKHLAKYYNKTKYSVSTTAGRDKQKLDPRLAYQYGSTEQHLLPIWTKDVPIERIEAWHVSAEAFYAQKQQQRERHQDPVTEMVVIHEEKVKADRVWEGLSAHFQDYDGKTVQQIKSKICAKWLNDGKAIPRPSDLHRYAVSLHMLNKFKGREIPEDAFEEKYSIE